MISFALYEIGISVICDIFYQEHAKKEQVNPCTPKKCGRFVLDGLFNEQEIGILKDLAERGTMVQGGGTGGASILELSSSTVSR